MRTKEALREFRLFNIPFDSIENYAFYRNLSQGPNLKKIADRDKILGQISKSIKFNKDGTIETAPSEISNVINKGSFENVDEDLEIIGNKMKENLDEVKLNRIIDTVDQYDNEEIEASIEILKNMGLNSSAENLKSLKELNKQAAVENIYYGEASEVDYKNYEKMNSKEILEIANNLEIKKEALDALIKEQEEAKLKPVKEFEKIKEKAELLYAHSIPAYDNFIQELKRIEDNNELYGGITDEDIKQLKKDYKYLRKSQYEYIQNKFESEYNRFRKILHQVNEETPIKKEIIKEWTDLKEKLSILEDLNELPDTTIYDQFETFRNKIYLKYIGRPTNNIYQKMMLDIENRYFDLDEKSREKYKNVNKEEATKEGYQIMKSIFSKFKK